MTELAETQQAADSRTAAGLDESDALHWFDFICPFCYVSQDRDEILIESGFDVANLPFQAHPEIPTEGILVGLRRGTMYEELERQAEIVGLALNWPDRLPNSRTALAASAWVRRSNPSIARQFDAKLFNAHFALGENLGDAGVLMRYAVECGADVKALGNAIADGSALREVSNTETIARGYGVRGTPAWLLRGTLIEGAVPVNDFRRLVNNVRGEKI